MGALVLIILVAFILRFGFLLIPIIPLIICINHFKEKKVSKKDILWLIISIVVAYMFFYFTNMIVYPLIEGMRTE
jgi:uncharacterized membrane protein